MSDQYKHQVQKLKHLSARYTPIPDDLGILHVGQEYNIHNPTEPNPPYILKATDGMVSMTMNPSAMLYSFGGENRRLFSATSGSCDPGCVIVHPDPRVQSVKPLYQPHAYKLPTCPAPTSYTVGGMYQPLFYNVAPTYAQ